MARTKLGSEFIEYLVKLTPRTEYVALFREIVLDVWRERHAAAAEARRRLDVRLVGLHHRKDQHDETFIYRHAIDRATYERRRDELAEETALAEMALNDARIDELDIEGVPGFAEHLLMNVGRMSPIVLDVKRSHGAA